MNTSANLTGSESSWVDLLKQQVSSLQYGVVQIVVHNRKVVQIERTEKFRFDHERSPNQPDSTGHR